MGRYKSVLMAEKDARNFAYTVDISVPGKGLGLRMDEMANWLKANAKAEWAEHGKMVEGRHVARYYFKSPWDAQAFEKQFCGNG